MKTRSQPVEIAVLLVFCLVFLAVAPDYLEFLHDPDAGTQLAKGQQILHGRHPWIQVDSSVYGPGIFYLSALAQLLGGERLLPEMILIFLGFLLSYALLFRSFGALAGRRLPLFVFAVLVLAAFPRFHKYHVVLPQALFLYGTWRALRAAQPRTAALHLALASTLAGLLRLDFGAYCVACAVLLLVLRYASAGWRVVLQGVAVLCGAGFALTGPWLIFLAVTGDLGEIAATSYETARGVLGGLEKSLPSYRFDLSPFAAENSLILVFWFFRLAAPSVAMVAAGRIFSRKRRGEDRLSADLYLLVAAVFASLIYLQASHRVDLSHIKQSLPATLFVLFLALARWWPRCLAAAALGRMTSLAALAALTALLGYPLLHPRLRQWESYSPARWARAVASWHLSRSEALAKSADRAPEPSLPKVLRRVRELTEPGDVVLFLPFHAQAYYFAGRHFETPHGWWNPGRFRAAGSQERFVRAMATTEIVVDVPTFSFDRLAERNARAYAPDVLRHVYSSYGIFEVIGHFVLTSRRPHVWQREGRYALELHRLERRPALPHGSENPTWTYEMTHLNTLPVASSEARFVMPWGAGLLLAMTPHSEAPDAEPPCRSVGLQGAKETFVVMKNRRPAVAQNLRGRRLIDTRAAPPGTYRLVLLSCPAEPSPTALRLEDTGVSITLRR